MHRRTFLLAVAAVARPDSALPDTLSLPDGFQPDGIAIGRSPYAYLGSRRTGDILRVSLRTGRRVRLSAGTGTPSMGLRLDRLGRLFVAGGTGGDARVLDAATGKLLTSYRLQTGSAVIDDVALAGSAAWFTDSANPVLFRLPLGAAGELPGDAVRVPLTGGVTATGITGTPDGRSLLLVQGSTGRLFQSTYAGRTTRVDLGGESLLYGDGMWLRGSVLYLVQNRDNVITKIQLDLPNGRGSVLSRTKDVRFDVPTALAPWKGSFYLPNARLTTAATLGTTYTAVSLAIP